MQPLMFYISFNCFSYVDDSTNGIYYQHSGSQGWKKIKGAAELQALTNPLGPSSSFKNEQNIRFQNAPRILPNIMNHSRQQGGHQNEPLRRQNFRQKNENYNNPRNNNVYGSNSSDKPIANNSSNKQYNRTYNSDYWRKNNMQTNWSADSVNSSNNLNK